MLPHSDHGITVWGAECPKHFSPLNSYWPTRKRKARKKGKMEKNKNLRKWAENHFFLLFENTEICLGQAKWKFLPGKGIAWRKKKLGKVALPPPKKYFYYATDGDIICSCLNFLHLYASSSYDLLSSSLSTLTLFVSLLASSPCHSFLLMSCSLCCRSWITLSFSWKITSNSE